MLRSMYSGISGMKNFQTKLDVLGNNIANVNTFGFKKGRTTFKDMVSQQIAGATGPGQGQGGVNARQVGLGMQLSSIDTIHTQGSLQNTNRELDLGISGDGYFVVGQATGNEWNGTDKNIAIDNVNLNYTRAGNFYLDSQGFIVNSDGLYLMGQSTNNANGVDSENDLLANQMGRIQIPTSAQSFSIGANGVVNYIDTNGELRIGGRVTLAKFPNPEGLQKVGDNLYQTSANSGNPNGEAVAANVGWDDFTAPGANGAGSLVAGTLEMSNVDLSEEFTEMIVAQRGFQANTRIITTSDEILQELVNLKR
ncbi:flagellar basal body rod protein FlgG [Halalkalibacter urbisdiaboli]|uniref:flagellar basal body rod protein FlgG n=1 Tax=Halalkalibacter urbisdiaboli TaxID=1960589 RepID=UPI000B436B35|nr:flagellar basal body rod protein FlgG [Halalkalibacter urbisdiaboli]